MPIAWGTKCNTEFFVYTSYTSKVCMAKLEVWQVPQTLKMTHDPV